MISESQINSNIPYFLRRHSLCCELLVPDHKGLPVMKMVCFHFSPFNHKTKENKTPELSLGLTSLLHLI